MPKSNNKRKNGTIKKAGAKPQKSFQQLVAEAANAKLLTTVQQEIYQLGGQIAQNQSRELSGIVTRLAAIEQVLIEKLGITEEQLTEKVATIEDQALGYERVEEVSSGDLVRLTVSTKKADAEEYTGESKLQVNNCGNSPFTLPQKLEEALITLKTGQTIEVPFGKDDSMKAKLTVDRVSRKIQEESNETESAE